MHDFILPHFLQGDLLNFQFLFRFSQLDSKFRFIFSYDCQTAAGYTGTA